MGFTRKLYYALSPSLRLAARRVYYFPIDLYEGITGKRGPMVPPRGNVFVGAGDFVKQGAHILEMLKGYAGLRPDSKVLDIGCGIGRLAVPLTEYLSKEGSYDGFDIVKKGIDWCREKISSRYPNFRFLHVDLKNDLYNLSTDAEAKQFVFPYPADSFDCVVLTSVFTHMMPEDVDNYLGQIALVMKEGGKCLATFFVLDDEVETRMKAGKTRFHFAYEQEGYCLMDEKVKEANIAFKKASLDAMLAKHKLRVADYYRGSWTGDDSRSLDFQDVLIITK